MRTLLRPFLAASALVLGLAGTPGALAQPPAASDGSITLKPVFTKGQEIRFNIKIDRSDTSTLNSPMTPAPAPQPEPKKDAAPAPDDSAPKADPGTVHPAPGAATRGSTGAASASTPAAQQPAAPAPKSEGLTAVSKVLVNSVQLLRVKDVTDAGANLELVIESINADITIPAGTFAYDSTKPEDDKDRDNIALQTFKPIVGLVLTLVTDKDGTITTISGGEEFQGGGAMAPYLQQFTNADSLRIRWNMILSAKKGGGTFKPGDTWDNLEAVPAKQLGARFELLTSHTLASISGGVATVKSTGSMRLVPLDPNTKMSFEIKEPSITATSTWLAADGIARTLDFNQSFRLEGNAQGMAVTRQSEVKTTISRAG